MEKSHFSHEVVDVDKETKTLNLMIKNQFMLNI